MVDHPIPFFCSLFLGLFVVVEIGYQVGLRTTGDGNDELRQEIVAARDAIGVLLSLLLAFTLAMVLTRYDSRKQLIVNEANAIGTVRLRAQMLSEPLRSETLTLLRSYLDERIRFTDAGLNEAELNPTLARANKLLDEIWQKTFVVAPQSPTPITALFVQSLNDMTDLSESRLAALENRVPGTLWMVLIFISMVMCLLVGCTLRRKAILILLIWPLMISIVMALCADLDSPRKGLIRIGQQSMERLR
ncbi:MAG TPA: DUF4239 domain-containing protein [Candidatus Acidoferrales bacterium]